METYLQNECLNKLALSGWSTDSWPPPMLVCTSHIYPPLEGNLPTSVLVCMLWRSGCTAHSNICSPDQTVKLSISYCLLRVYHMLGTVLRFIISIPHWLCGPKQSFRFSEPWFLHRVTVGMTELTRGRHLTGTFPFSLSSASLCMRGSKKVSLQNSSGKSKDLKRSRKIETWTEKPAIAVLLCLFY